MVHNHYFRITMLLVFLNVLFVANCSNSEENKNSGNPASKTPSGSLQFTIDGQSLTYKSTTNYCISILDTVCTFSASGSNDDYPQIEISFPNTTTSGSVYTTSTSSFFTSTHIRYYKESCDRDSGNYFTSLNTKSGTLNLTIDKYITNGVAITEQVSGTAIATLKPNSTASGSIQITNASFSADFCGPSSGSTSDLICAPAGVTLPIQSFNIIRQDINLNQSSSQNLPASSSQCYQFTTGSAGNYTLNVSNLSTGNQWALSYQYKKTSSTITFSGCNQTGNATCTITSVPASQLVTFYLTEKSSSIAVFDLMLSNP